MAKRAPLGGISSLASVKPTAAVATASPETAEEARGRGRPKTLPENVRSYTLRLPADVLRQLNQLALDQDVSTRSLLLKGIDMVFAENRLPTIASESSSEDA